MGLYYVSFASPVGWHGASWIEAGNLVDATKFADEQKINPGGREMEVLAFQYDTLDEVPPIASGNRNRLLTGEEVLKVWPDAKDISTYEDHIGE